MSYCPGTLPRSSREAMPRLNQMGTILDSTWAVPGSQGLTLRLW